MEPQCAGHHGQQLTGDGAHLHLELVFHDSREVGGCAAAQYRQKVECQHGCHRQT